MTGDFQSTEGTLADNRATGGALIDPGLWEAKEVLFFSHITLNSQGKSKSLYMFTFPAGVIPIGFTLATDTSLGSAQVSIGITGTTAKYRDLATFTTTDQWVTFMKPDAGYTRLTAEEDILITNDATAALPGSGNLWCIGRALKR